MYNSKDMLYFDSSIHKNFTIMKITLTLNAQEVDGIKAYLSEIDGERLLSVSVLGLCSL